MYHRYQKPGFTWNIIQADKLHFTKQFSHLSYFHLKAYVVGTPQNCLIEAILMSTHNMCFYSEIVALFCLETIFSWHCELELTLILNRLTHTFLITGLHSFRKHFFTVILQKVSLES